VFFDQWLVAVAKYDHVGLLLAYSFLEHSRKALRVAKNVDHEDAQTAEFEGLHLLHAGRDIAFIDVAPNGCDGGNLFKLSKHPQVTNVARVEDVAHSFEHAGKLGIKLPVCVGNHSDEFLIHGGYPAQLRLPRVVLYSSPPRGRSNWFVADMPEKHRCTLPRWFLLK